MTYHTLSCPDLSCPVLSCPVLSCTVMSCHVMSCHVMSCHVMSHHTKAHDIMSHHITSHHTTPLHPTAPTRPVGGQGHGISPSEAPCCARSPDRGSTCGMQVACYGDSVMVLRLRAFSPSLMLHVCGTAFITLISVLCGGLPCGRSPYQGPGCSGLESRLDLYL